MSIDDMIGRDTRIDRLARLCGWSRRETRACLEDIWAVCYDRIVPYLPADDIEVTALRDAISPPAHADGFVAALIAVGLARPATKLDCVHTRKDGSKLPWPDQRWQDRLYLCGAGERVGYQLVKKAAGQQGGVKSGESRRSKTKQSFAFASSEHEAPGNPSASASASDLASRDSARPPAAKKHLLPSDWIPERSRANTEAETAAKERGVDLRTELKNLRDWAKANNAKKADWDATWRNWTRNAKAGRPPAFQQGFAPMLQVVPRDRDGDALPPAMPDAEAKP